MRLDHTPYWFAVGLLTALLLAVTIANPGL